jgi:hypothetical protein
MLHLRSDVGVRRRLLKRAYVRNLKKVQTMQIRNLLFLLWQVKASAGSQPVGRCHTIGV